MKLITQSISHFYFGFTLPYQAFRMILKHKALLFLSLIPILLTLALYYFILNHLNGFLEEVLKNYLVSFGYGANSLLSNLLSLFIKILLFLISVLTFTFTSTLLASPINDFLAEKTEKYIQNISKPMPTNFFTVFKLMRVDIGKSIILIFVGFFTLVFCWVPILNIFGMTLTLLLLSFQYITYPQTRRGLYFRQSILFLRVNFFASLGFGSILFLLFSIPFLSSFVLPLAVVGGTILYSKGEKNTLNFIQLQSR